MPKKLDEIIEEKYVPKKHKNAELARSYSRLGLDRRAVKVSDCGYLLKFGELPSGKFDLIHGSFCKDRLCPLCNWRRSMKLYTQLSEMIDYISGMRYIFVTFTVPNCPGFALSDMIDNLERGWRLLTKKKAFKLAFEGYFKTLEITYNYKHHTFHPHFHVIFAVKPSYFRSVNYIKQSELLQLWRECMNDFSISQLNMQAIDFQSQNDIVKEVGKYTVKDSDYLFKNKAVTDLVVSFLVEALASRRLCSFAGVFFQARKALKLSDPFEPDDWRYTSEGLVSDKYVNIFTYYWGKHDKYEVSCTPTLTNLKDRVEAACSSSVPKQITFI